MDLGLAGKVALIGGSSSGLGLACALELAREGCRVAITAREENGLVAAKNLIEKETGAKVFYVSLDLSKKSDIEKSVKLAVKEFGTIHILVNNSGGPKHGGVLELGETDWAQGYEQVLLMVKRMTENALPFMRKQRWGRIINIASLSVKQPRSDLVLSNVFRSAVVSYSKTLSKEVAKENITVNCIAPGTFETERSKELMEFNAKKKGKNFEQFKKDLIAGLPMNRLLEPKELAALAAFLASERASAITGTTIQVDGGQYNGLF